MDDVVHDEELHKREEYDEDDYDISDRDESQGQESDDMFDRTPFEDANIEIPHHDWNQQSKSKHELQTRDVEFLKTVVNASDRASVSARTIDKTNFADLYQCFETFARANNLNSNTYGNYFECLNVLTRLCNYHQDTWSLRLNQFLHEYSSKEARRQRNEVLQLQIKIFQRNRLRRAWETWQIAYIQQDVYLASLSAVAEQRDRRLLLSEVLRNWGYRKEKNRSQYQVAVQTWKRQTQQSYFYKFLLKRDKVLADSETMVRMIWIKFFYRWQHKIALKWSNELTAVELRSHFDKKNSFKSWKFLFLEYRQQQRWNKVIATSQLYKWIAELDIQLEHQDRAVEFCHKTLLRRFYKIWVSRNRYYIDQKSVAQSHYSRNTSQEFFDYWKKGQLLESKATPLFEHSRTKYTTIYFCGWSAKTKFLLEAKRFYRFMALYRYFHYWKLRASEHKVIRQVDLALLTDRFYQWVLRERLSLFQRYYKSRLIFNHFKKWVKVTQVSRRKSVSLQRLSDRFLALSLKVKLIAVWKTKFSLLTELHCRSCRIYNYNLAKTFFYTAHDRVLTIASGYSEAEALYRSSIQSKIFHKWKILSIESRHTKADKSLIVYNRRKVYILVLSAFKLWKDKTETVKRGLSAAIDLDEKSIHTLSKNILVSWIERCSKVSREIDLSVEIYQSKTVAVALEVWREAYRKEEQKKDMADLLLSEVVLAQAQQIFRLWRMRLFKLQTMERNADHFFERLMQYRLRTTWRLWRAQRSKNSGLESSTFDGLDALFETPSRVMGQMRIPRTSGGGRDSNQIKTAASVERWRKMNSPFILPTPRRIMPRTPLKEPSQ